MGYTPTEMTTLSSGVPIENKYKNRFSGQLLIAGTGRCAWSDMNGLPEPESVMTINDMTMYWPGRVKFAYSHDERQLAHWAAGRRRKYTTAYGPIGSLHTIEPCRVSGFISWPYPTMGSSSLAACHVGLSMGFDEILMIGCPLDDSGHFYDPPRMASNFINEAPTNIWEKAQREFFKGRVQSQSGRSREILSS